MKKRSLAELNRHSVEAYRTLPKHPMVIVCDNIRSGMNIGSIFRTSDAFLVEKIYLCGISSTPPHREILKTAIGATDSVQWEYFKDVKDCVLKLKEDDYTLFAIEQTDSAILLDDLSKFQFEKAALILGNEVKGVSDEILPFVDQSIEIPQYGTKHSLNVSVCAGIVIYEFSKMF